MYENTKSQILFSDACLYTHTKTNTGQYHSQGLVNNGPTINETHHLLKMRSLTYEEYKLNRYSNETVT
uniref:Uncharacterized protein n=1 Tax=Arion vulgaris TaxID=1028688 RepID=A0A0B7B1W4_9EUPU